MPHLSVEYSSGMEAKADMRALCQTLHAALMESGIFPLAGVRVRAYRADHAIIADDHPDNEFVALTLSVGAGRSTETLRGAGDLLFAAAQKALAGLLAAPHFALSLEIRVADPELSWKDTPLHARLSGRGAS
ncbi:MAG: 5-carboxymethyl-2-hydroxymuconate Delta-isomerase [Neomegalonema sp.]|nr:5-carboxymethyl-2-hydroxymuconate Delta-isomerase [Neomegalonema sp.]